MENKIHVELIIAARKWHNQGENIGTAGSKSEGCWTLLNAEEMSKCALIPNSLQNSRVKPQN
jgi:hypothetical protein